MSDENDDGPVCTLLRPSNSIPHKLIATELRVKMERIHSSGTDPPIYFGRNAELIVHLCPSCQTHFVSYLLGGRRVTKKIDLCT
jgi:hypothetical protein